MKNKICTMFAVLFCMLSIAGCTHNDSNNPENIPPSQSFSFFFSPVNNYVPKTILSELNGFGTQKDIVLPNSIVEVHDEIPTVENDAKGLDPICIVMPELDLADYEGPYIWSDEQTGLEVSAYYRVVAGMPTDELVKVYIDSSGNIKQYETVNLGKYDNLDLDEESITKKCDAFQTIIYNALQNIAVEFYAYPNIHASSAYMLCTDEVGNIVIKTTAVLSESDDTKQESYLVNLYAVIGW